MSAPQKTKLSDDHVKQKKIFVQRHEGWVVEERKNVMFTDESSFFCSSGHSSRVWCSSRVNKFEPGVCRNLIESIPNPLQMAKKNNFGPTKY